MIVNLVSMIARRLYKPRLLKYAPITLVLISGIVYAAYARQARNEAIRVIETLGGTSVSHEDNLFKRPTQVSFFIPPRQPVIQASDFESLLTVSPDIEYLDLSYTEIGDDAMRCLQRAHQLRHLTLWKTYVTNQGIECLATLPNLEHLDVCNTLVDDGAAPTIAAMPSLMILEVAPGQLTPDAIQLITTSKSGRVVRAINQVELMPEVSRIYEDSRAMSLINRE